MKISCCVSKLLLQQPLFVLRLLQLTVHDFNLSLVLIQPGSSAQDLKLVSLKLLLILLNQELVSPILPLT